MLDTSSSAADLSELSTSYKKKLIEVGLPLDAINNAAKKEKTTTNGHPSTFHLWWGHRPFSVVRALIFATLVDDPSSRPDIYRTLQEQNQAREELFSLIAALVEWKNLSRVALLDQVRDWLARLSGSPDDVTIVDPFCGRGTIPLEAQRLGCRVLGSDLNPVAVLISKGLVEIPRLFRNTTCVSPELSRLDRTLRGSAAIAADIEAYGDQLLAHVRATVSKNYPNVKLASGDEATVLAWLWARTIKCPNPICSGAETPLLKSNILSSKPGRIAFLKPVIARSLRRVEFVVSHESGAAFSNVVAKKGAKCVFCHEPISLAYIREAATRGELRATLIGGVIELNGSRSFLGSQDMAGSVPEVRVLDKLLDVDLTRNSRHMGPTVYGLLRHRDLYTDRQLATLSALSSAISIMRVRIEADALKASYSTRGKALEDGGSDAKAYADAIATYLGMAVSRLADRCSTLAFWQADESVGHVFVRPALPMTWDFVEPNPLATSAGSFINCVRSIAKTVGKLPASSEACIRHSDSRELEYPPNSVIVTDPPYYDNIPYADISEYFYVWLRESLKDVWPNLMATLTTPKVNELTFDRSRHQGSAKIAREYFAKGFEETFVRWREQANSDYPSLVFYAFRATEKAANNNGVGKASVVSQGWESILSSLISSQYQITGTWPIGTERGNRFRSIESNALASSIVLVCRPRPYDAPQCTRLDLLGQLRTQLPPAVKRLRDENLAATDLEQAAIGPGMAVFSRFSQVLEPDGNPMSVRSALALINDELAQILLGEIADVDAETHFALAWFDGHFYDEANYGEAEVLLKAKNASLEALRDSGVLKAERGIVQLLSPRSAALEATRGDVWLNNIPSFAQLIHIIAALVAEDGGAEVAASMLRTVGSDNSGRLKDIAYHCYLICDRAKRSKEAQDFNEFVTAYADLQKQVSLQASEAREARLL